MHPYPFEYHRAASVDEALTLLTEHGDDGKLLAGGHSLLPVMKLRLAQPAHLIDISAIRDLQGIRVNGDVVEIGALTTHHMIAIDATLKEHLGLLPEIAHVVGDQQVRNRGTIGGTLAHADPAADYPAGVLALNAEIVAVGPSGERVIPVAEFFLGFLTTALEPQEIITAVRFPVLKSGTGFRYEKMANPASGYAIVGVAAVVETAADGTVSDLRVGITGAGDVAYRATGVEDALRGSSLDQAAVRLAAEHAIDGVEVLGDVHAPVEYRGTVTKNLTRRAILTAFERARA
ncbi:MAG TPA: xanthine dehydrogenase family protein subunit M [Thermomicrobiales bacterium]|nr:xanthine dehydrogenase family protein subunit M [Thermomicrobiales bacterium]